MLVAWFSAMFLVHLLNNKSNKANSPDPNSTSAFFLLPADRRHPEAAEQRHGRADQQNAAGPAERHHLSEGGVQEADAGGGAHSGYGQQKHVGRCGPGQSQGQFSQTSHSLEDITLQRLNPALFFFIFGLVVFFLTKKKMNK